MSLEQPGLAANATDSRSSGTPAADHTREQPTRYEPGTESTNGDPGAAGRTARRAPAAGRRAPTRRRARKVHRIVRRIDPWSVLRFSLLFYLCTFLILIIAGVLLWGAARGGGVVEGLEGFIADIGGYERFELDGEQIFRAAFLGGLVLVVAGAAATVLLSVLFNLISDVVGGIRLSVIEEESAVPVSRGARGAARSEPQRAPRPPSVSES